MTSCLSLLPKYIRTVSSWRLLSALLIWYKLVYGQFGHSNMHSSMSLLGLLWKTQSGLASSLKVSQQMLCVQSIAIYDGTFGNYRLHGLVQRAGTLRRYFYQYFSHQLDFGKFQVFICRVNLTIVFTDINWFQIQFLTLFNQKIGQTFPTLFSKLLFSIYISSISHK